MNKHIKQTTEDQVPPAAAQCFNFRSGYHLRCVIWHAIVVVECSSASGSQYSPLHLVDSASLPSFLFRSSECRNEVSVPQRFVPYPGPRLAAGRLGGGTPLYQLYVSDIRIAFC
eukprot:sb/3476870/